MKTRTTLIFAILLVAALPMAAQTKRAITFDDLISLDRVTDPQISPDGKWVAYVVATPDKAANRNARNIWLVPSAGGEARQLTRSGRDGMPRWSPDGTRLALVSARDGSPQIYLLALEGGEARKLTSISTGVDDIRWSPDGKAMSFTSEVFPDCKDDACNAKRDADAEKSKVKARVYESLLYRHWDVWEDGKRSHLFYVPLEGRGPEQLSPGTARDLTAGLNADVPPVQRGGAASIAFSPDSKEMCYTAVTDPVEATSTNGDLFVASVAGGEAQRITTNPGFDGDPVYSPDGKTIAYRSQLRSGYESDRWRLMLYDRASGRHTNLTEPFDRSVDAIAWAPDSKTIYFHAEDKAQEPVYAIAATGGTPKTVLKDGYYGEYALSNDGKTLVFSRSSQTAPAELFAAASDGSGTRPLTRHNEKKLAALELSAAEHFWYEGAENVQVHGMLVRPPGFDVAKKYPLLVLVHGGPQGAWNDSWGYRWNPQMFAAPGYVVVMLNPRGSTGFGQRITDDINADWGGRVFVDLMKGVDHVVAKYPFVDASRMAAAGGSYGGYMMNWFASQTKGRFKALISHAGIFNKETMYGTTEELWFEEWEMQGTPWDNKAMYDRWSPHLRAAEIGKYKTPMLVIAGELDYRVPYTQSLDLFTALQRQGVPSKLLVYPDEGHWILKPQNSELWYKTFLGWLATYLK